MRPLRQCLSNWIVGIASLGLHLLDPKSKVSPDFIVLFGCGLPVLGALDGPAVALRGEWAVRSRGLGIFFVKGVVGGLVAENVCDESGHAILTFKLGALNALEALRVWLFPEDLLLVWQHYCIFLR